MLCCRCVEYTGSHTAPRTRQRARAAALPVRKVHACWMAPSLKYAPKEKLPCGGDERSAGETAANGRESRPCGAAGTHKHLKQRVVPRGEAHVVQVVVLAASAHAALGGDCAVELWLCHAEKSLTRAIAVSGTPWERRIGAINGRGRGPAARRTSLNCTIPAFVNSSVGSRSGTSRELGNTVCPFPSK